MLNSTKKNLRPRKSFWRKKVGNILKKGPFQWIPDELYLKLRFYIDLGRRLDLDNPRTYNEKIQWLKLHDRRSEMIGFVDKYAVRDYIKQIIGEKYLVPLLGVYNRFAEIDFEQLPNAFVLKCTHDSGGYVICKDKSKLNLRAAQRTLGKRLKLNYYDRFREWPYKYVKPRIICEEYLQDNITDYKFLCFHGEPKLIQVHRDRENGHTLDFYDVNWHKTSIRRFTKTAEGLIPRPQCLEEMLWVAQKLSKDEIHVRIDLYEVDGKVYFGEKTYYSGSGLVPFAKDEYDELLGCWIRLPVEWNILDKDSKGG